MVGQMFVLGVYSRISACLRNMHEGCVCVFFSLYMCVCAIVGVCEFVYVCQCLCLL